MNTTAEVQVHIDEEGRVYPLLSDTPIPKVAIQSITHSRGMLRQGDLVIDASGQPYRVDSYTDSDFGPFSVLMANDVNSTAVWKSLAALEAPLIRIYSTGQPRYDYINH
jgi:hypothetical protein